MVIIKIELSRTQSRPLVVLFRHFQTFHMDCHLSQDLQKIKINHQYTCIYTEPKKFSNTFFSIFFLLFLEFFFKHH